MTARDEISVWLLIREKTPFKEILENKIVNINDECTFCGKGKEIISYI